MCVRMLGAGVLWKWVSTGGGGGSSVEYESHVCDVMSCDVM
jgi:hypothetical protein